MIEINQDIVIEVGMFVPFEDSKRELLETLYGLIEKIHKEPYCMRYELFIDAQGRLMSQGRWHNKMGYELHTHMQYRENFIRQKLPVFCQSFDYRLFSGVIPPMTALSLMQD